MSKREMHDGEKPKYKFLQDQVVSLNEIDPEIQSPIDNFKDDYIVISKVNKENVESPARKRRKVG
jgi:hypothetical protein